MNIIDNTAFIVGGYSWEDNKMTKLFPVNEVTRVVFDENYNVNFVDTIQILTPVNFSPFISGFSSASYGDQIYLFGGIPYDEYNPERKNMFELVPPVKKRNHVPSPLATT